MPRLVAQMGRHDVTAEMFNHAICVKIRLGMEIEVNRQVAARHHPPGILQAGWNQGQITWS